MTLRTFQIYRYDPDQDARPRMQSIEVELDGSERMLLDALMKLKAVDPTLSFRRSCREGVCGSDAMNINGRNGLACLTNMRTLPGTVVLKPLPGLPVIRDLIVDMTQFFQQYHSIRPYLVNDTLPPEKERLQSPEERDELNGLYECILCASCSTACPSFWWNPDKFVGPAGLLQAYRFIADSRDHATGELRHTQTVRRTIISLILPIARVGFSPFGQTSTQFMMVWQRNSRYGSSRLSSRAAVSRSRLSTMKR
jgi:succinate dehydrogenase / fumarate reductase iron-sulfur subunit